MLRTGLVVLVVVASLTVGACSSHSSHSSSVSIPDSAPFNATDVAFAQGMIPHHAQAIDMADMVPTRSTNAALLALARQIRAAQDPEIATMTGWLTAWDQPLPVMGDHSDHDMSSMGSMMMSGMMSAADMDRLEASSGTAFDRMWLEMMIEHHEGAVEMARAELASGKDPAAQQLARAIIDGQSAEITEMQAMVRRLPG